MYRKCFDMQYLTKEKHYSIISKLLYSLLLLTDLKVERWMKIFSGIKKLSWCVDAEICCCCWRRTRSLGRRWFLYQHSPSSSSHILPDHPGRHGVVLPWTVLRLNSVVAHCACIIIIIIKTMFIVLSSWQSHCESSPGSFDERRMVPSGHRPKTKPDDLGCESACTVCQNLHPPSPFVIITQLESWYSFYRPTEGRRLSRPSCLVTYRDGLPVHCRSPILVLTGCDVAQLRWSKPTCYH